MTSNCLNGFPVLDESFQTSLPGLYITGFSATQDFGPFFGFVKGAPAAAILLSATCCSAVTVDVPDSGSLDTSGCAQ